MKKRKNEEPVITKVPIVTFTRQQAKNDLNKLASICARSAAKVIELNSLSEETQDEKQKQEYNTKIFTSIMVAARNIHNAGILLNFREV